MYNTHEGQRTTSGSGFSPSSVDSMIKLRLSGSRGKDFPYCTGCQSAPDCVQTTGKMAAVCYCEDISSVTRLLPSQCELELLWWATEHLSPQSGQQNKENNSEGPCALGYNTEAVSIILGGGSLGGEIQKTLTWKTPVTTSSFPSCDWSWVSWSI